MISNVKQPNIIIKLNRQQPKIDIMISNVKQPNIIIKLNRQPFLIYLNVNF